MYRVQPVFFTCTAAVFLFAGCSMPPPLKTDDVPPLSAGLFPEQNFRQVTALGKVELSIDGETHAGTAEVRWKNTGELSADFYAPLGIIVASVKAADGRGKVVFDDKEYTFTMTQTMDSLPFAWGRDLTFGDLARILLAQPPALYGSYLKNQPDSLAHERRTISIWWKTDSIGAELRIRRRSHEPEKVMFVCKKRSAFWSLTMSAFAHQRAQKIELRENDKNYFSIRYTEVNSN